MLPSLSKKLAILSLLAVLTACGSSSSGGAKVAEFGMSVCSLGCNGTSFSTNSHPANKDITFTFNDAVDPTTVNFSSISIVDKATGVTPTGSFIVSGKVVIFRPTLIESSSGLQFGFLTGSTYRVQVLDDTSANAVSAKSGRINQTFVTGDITITEPTDLVPGAPVLLSISPEEGTIPATRDFDIVMVFSDVMQTLPLANPDTGQSSLVTVSTFDSGSAQELVVPGTFTAVVDRDLLLTTLTFTPSVPFPGDNGGTRILRVSLSQQIVDLVGTGIANAGIRIINLPEIVQTPGTLTETFTDTSKEDDDGSTAGLWSATSGALDSGQDPLTGLHKGGGSGVLGYFEPSEGLFAFDTDGETFTSELLGEDVTVNGGVYPFTQVQIGSGTRIEAVGANPLRLFAQGAVQVDGTMDFSGEDAAAHRGKILFSREIDDEGPHGGSTFLESDHGIITDGADTSALGGAPGTGSLGAGSGGTGGKAWLHDSIAFGGGAGVYYNTDFTTFEDWERVLSGIAAAPEIGRYLDGKAGSVYCGTNAEGVGGVAATGVPLSGNPNNLHDDQDNGSGMGSWAWPPTSNEITDSTFSTTFLMTTHPTAFPGGVPSDFAGYAIHRSRGGGGGGYWNDGERGLHFDAGSTNPLGAALDVPVIDVANSIMEFNDDGTGTNHLFWDVLNGGAASLPDADGGRYVPAVGIETLDPALGLLMGGSGGGGAGMSQHGSIENRFGGAPDGEVGTYRMNPGGGGGAGGGALQIQAGSRLAVNGAIQLDGGRGGDSEFMIAVPFGDTNAIDFGPPGDAGGGGGSGGAALLQANALIQADLDAISVAGGEGGLGAAGNHGGAGGSGLVRFETATGTETLSTLEGFVTPDAAVDLTPIGSPGVANVSTISTTLAGAVGDVTAGDGTVFNGNASGVRSRWYEPAASIQGIQVTGWTVEVEYFDGAVQNLTFSDTNLTDPDSTPVWIAFQGGWITPGGSGLPEPTVINQTAWAVPSVNGVTTGFDQLNADIIRAVRYQLVFDHDQINALITGVAGGYFRVTDVTIDFLGD